jgi:hypothetical protein
VACTAPLIVNPLGGAVILFTTKPDAFIFVMPKLRHRSVAVDEPRVFVRPKMTASAWC